MTGVAAHGAWPSPLRPSDLADAGVRMGGLFVHGDATFWLEGRAAEGGRSVLVRRSADGAVTDVTVADHNVRTLVHEYGGGDLAVVGDDVVYANFADQRLYRQPLAGGEPVAVTAEPASPRSVRYADARPSPDGAWLYAVRERHLDDGDVVNDVVAISLDDGTTVEVIARGGDFYAAPRPSPDGRRLAYLTWDHPQMPWDGTELRLVDLDGGSATGDRALIGGIDEAVQQPTWTDDGRLLAVTDRSGWWALHDVDLAAGGSTARHHHDLDFGGPMWQFGLQTFAPRSDGSTVVTWSEDGREHLGVLAADGGLHRSGCPFTTYGRPVPLADGRVATVAASTSVPLAAVVVDPVDGSVEVLHAPSPAPDPTWVSVPEHVSFPTTGDRTAHALWYPPVNPDHRAPDGELPPLIVMSHGGPTGAARPMYAPMVQFFTSRGFGVVDVNYGGSTGYGRVFRNQLRGQWGLVDVDDCIAAAQWLADQGLVDPERLAIRGGSAGGYTTLCALTFHDVFAAGCSLYGVADAETLATDTHKFESRYLDSMIGPYPEARDTYVERSPIHFTDRLRAPMVLLQGLEDAIVPPSQAEAMVAALDAGGIPHAYVPFEGEQHGFRQAATIERAAEVELSFYAQIFGFEPAGDITPVELRHHP